MKLLMEVGITMISLPFQRVALEAWWGLSLLETSLALLKHVFNLTP